MGGPMEYGITFPRGGVADQPSPLKYLTNFAREAEQMGCAYGVIGDRLEAGIDPFSVLTAIAEASGRMRLVTSVLVLPPRGILVAPSCLPALDVLTGGVSSLAWARVRCSVTMKSWVWTTTICGPASRKACRRCALTSPLARRPSGQILRYRQASPGATPVQRPSLPIWIGSWGSTAGLRRVARLADGWLSSAGPGHQSPEQFAKDVKRLNAFLVQEGKDPATFPSAVSTMALFISEDQAELARMAAPALSHGQRASVCPAGRAPDEDAHAHDMVGTRAACLDKVRRWQAAGVNALFLVPRGADPVGQMRIFLNDVASKA